MITHPTSRNRVYLLGRRVRTRGIQFAFHSFLSRRLRRLRKRQNTQTDMPPNNADPLRDSPTPADLRIRSENAKWGGHYTPSRKHIFTKAIRSLPIRFEDYAFIDLGSGKGEALLLAAEYGFTRVVGVEYSEALTEIASTNVRNATGLMCKSIECICADATEFHLSHDPAVVYLFNPFQGRVMDKVVRNIEQTLRAVPRELWIVYVNPWEHRKFVRSHHLKTILENWDEADEGNEFCIYRSIT
jgi:predicted RNA methylase